jgi:hypothetical protein
MQKICIRRDIDYQTLILLQHHNIIKRPFFVGFNRGGRGEDLADNLNFIKITQN